MSKLVKANISLKNSKTLKSEITECNTAPCPFWSAWDDCSRTCGGGTRSRQLNDGSDSVTERCNIQSCPVQVCDLV